MSNVFTLDALREETIKRYEPVLLKLSDGSTIELKSVLRLGKKDREAVTAAIEEIEELDDAGVDEDDEQDDEYAEKVCEVIEKVFKLISSKPKRLISELEHDDPKVKVHLYTAVLKNWMGESQLGEAESSPS